MTQEFTSQPQPEKRHQSFNQFLLKLIIVIVVICLSGIGLGIWYNQLPVHHPERNQSACEQAGGEWLTDHAVCLLSHKEAGDSCTDGGQCQSGVCFPPDLTEEQQATITSGNKVSGLTGTCYPEEEVMGCVKQILKGVVSRESLCYE